MECTNIEESTNLIEIEGLQWQKGSLLLSIMTHTIFTLSQNILVVVLSLFFSPNRDFINKFQSSRFPCIHGGGILMETKALDSLRSLAMFKNNFKLKW